VGRGLSFSDSFLLVVNSKEHTDCLWLENLCSSHFISSPDSVSSFARSVEVITLHAGEDVGNRNSHLLLVGMQNDTAIEEDSLAVLYKIKHTLAIQFSESCSLVFSQMS